MTRLLRYLIRVDREGYFSGRNASGKNVLAGFEANEGRRRENEVEERRSNQNLRKLVSTLRDRLELYYSGLEFEAPDRVHIQIARGRGGKYKPTIRYLPEVRASGDFRFVGNNAEALAYLARRIPRAVRVEDTTIRWNEAESLYQTRAFADVLAGLRSSKADFRFVIGPVVDSIYVNGIKEVFSEAPVDRVKCFLLHHAAPIMNFLILSFEDGTSEVLFGYGTQNEEVPILDTAVFSTTDGRLTNEFRKLFNVLCSPRFSLPLEVSNLGFAGSGVHACDVLSTFRAFPQEDIELRLQKCRSHVKVCVTAWPLLGDAFEPHIKDALHRGCKVEIVLWGTESEFVRMRGMAVRGDPEYVRNQVVLTREAARRIGSHTNLTIQSCEGHAAMSLFWIDDVIVFGAYWVGFNASNGPHFLVHSSSFTGKFLQDQYRRMQAQAGLG